MAKLIELIPVYNFKFGIRILFVFFECYLKVVHAQLVDITQHIELIMTAKVVTPSSLKL